MTAPLPSVPGQVPPDYQDALHAPNSTKSVVLAGFERGYRDSFWRSVVKSLSYRVTGFVATAGIVLAVTGEPALATAIGLTDTIVKLGIFFGHERVWERISFGRARPPDYQI